MSTIHRPARVTVIAWLLIVSGALGVLSIPFTLAMRESRELLERSGVPLGISIALTVLLIAVALTCGIAMLARRNWGRVLYLWFGPISIALEWVLRGFRPMSILSVIGYLVILWLLTSPPTIAYFKGERAAPTPAS